MPAPEGNEFWKLRSKHGRDRLFSNPNDLWEAASDYFSYCVDNPLLEVDYVGKDARKVEKPKMVAFTMHGLCLYLGVNTNYFWTFKESLKNKTDAISEDFCEVITRIEETVYHQKFVGAAAGFLNPNIIARDLGLTDKRELKAQNEITVEYFNENGEGIDPIGF